MNFKLTITSIVDDELELPSLDAAREYAANLQESMNAGAGREKIIVTIEPVTPASEATP